MARKGITNELGRRARPVVVAAGILMVVAPAGALAQPTTYEATCRVLVKAAPLQTTSSGHESFRSMQRLIEGPSVAARSAVRLNVPVERILDRVSVSHVAGTELIELRTTDHNASFAASSCDSFAMGFLEARLATGRERIGAALATRRDELGRIRTEIAAIEAHRSTSDAERLRRLSLSAEVTRVLEQIVDLVSASEAGLASSGEIVSPAGSTARRVGPNHLFPLGLMTAGAIALAVTALIPRRLGGAEANEGN